MWTLFFIVVCVIFPRDRMHYYTGFEYDAYVDLSIVGMQLLHMLMSLTMFLGTADDPETGDCSN